MANRAGFEVRDSLEGRAGEVNTLVASSAATNQIVTGPTIGMKSEGEQVAAALSRFAPAGSNLLKGVFAEYKEKKTKEGVVLRELGQELPPDASEYTAEGYNSVSALNKHYEMATGFDQWSAANPQATPQEAQAKWTQMYGETRDVIKPYGQRILDVFDGNSAKAGITHITKHTALNTKFIENRNTVELGRLFTSVGKAAAEADPDTPDGKEQIETFKGLLTAMPDNAVGGVQDRKSRMGMVFDMLNSSITMGNDKLLKLAEETPNLALDPDMNDKIAKLRKAFNTEQDKVLTTEKLVAEGELLKGVRDNGWSEKVAVEFSDKHRLKMTSEQYWSWMNTYEINKAKKAASDEMDTATMNGHAYALEGKTEATSESINRVGKRIESSYATAAEGQLARMAWMIKHGYEDNALKRQFEAIASLPVGDDGAVPVELNNAIQLWRGVKQYAAQGKDLTRQFGPEAMAYFRDVEFLSTKNSTSLGLAAKEVQRLRADKPHMERTERKIESDVEAKAHAWRSKHSIDAPRDIAAITEHAKMLVRTGLATTTDGAIETAIDRFKADHTRINGQWVGIQKEALDMKIRGGAKVMVDGVEAMRQHFEQPTVKRALGIDGTKFDNMTFVPTADGSGVTAYIVDARGVAMPVPGVHKFADMGKVAVTADLARQAKAINEGDRLDKDTKTLEAAIRNVLLGGGPAEFDGSTDPSMWFAGSNRLDSKTKVLNGLTQAELGYNLAQWNSLDDQTRHAEVVRIANYAAAKAAGVDTKPYSMPAKVFKHTTAKEVHPVDVVVKGIINAENGGDNKTFVRTRDTSGEVSSAYGPMQVTKTLAEDVRKKLAYKFTVKEQEFLDRFVEHGKQILANDKNPLTPQFGPGGIGSMSAEDKAMYIPVFTKVVKHYMEKYDNNLVRVASVWRYGEGKGAKQDAPAGYLLNFFKNIKS